MAKKKKLDPKSDMIGTLGLAVSEGALEIIIKTLQDVLDKAEELIDQYNVCDVVVGSGALGDLHSYLIMEIDKWMLDLEKSTKKD